MTTDEFAYMTATELALHIRRRDISPVEALEAAIARIEARNPSLNALIYLGFDDAREAAKQAEDAIMRGSTIGPLHGVPVAIKDLFDFKPGWPSTFGGIRALKNHVTQFYCTFAERVERGGAIIVGKTNSPVMGLRGTCDNYLFGPREIPSILPRIPVAHRAAVRRRLPMGCYPSPRGPTAAARSGFRRRGAEYAASNPPLDAFR